MATMCRWAWWLDRSAVPPLTSVPTSGTESPLIALELISREMKAVHSVPFEVEHVFSCELEPFKQAYIERNFAPRGCSQSTPGRPTLTLTVQPSSFAT